ncbi:AbrB/MazE/SpoVT family DNA-binding domain-containing protein [Burkholderia contaminans]|uniref:AbrB/MazE/SpoVT family DNA-binding domain-containing protein n=1 Tax=Burkholderia contaminans TaxID=488447 RepID=UPI00158E362C|nr:AbrB/MazE/SpoVT family DNA-binding domain-containing protein [Burkholderia contaminans]
MRQTVKKWGNSLALRLPATVAEAARLVEDQEVEVSVDGQGKIVVESTATADNFDFDLFVASIVAEDVPPLVDIGEPLGRELGGDEDPYHFNQCQPAHASVEYVAKQVVKGTDSRKLKAGSRQKEYI